MSFQPSSFISDDPFLSLLCIYFFPLKSPIGSNRSILFFLQPFSMSVCTVCITVYYIQIQPYPIVYLLTRYLYTRFTSVLKCLYTMDCLVFIQKRSLKLAGPLGVTNKGFGKAYDRKQMQMRESPPTRWICHTAHGKIRYTLSFLLAQKRRWRSHSGCTLISAAPKPFSFRA